MIIGPALLFCPADRPDRYEKAVAAGDSVILDLEDAVSLDAKPRARATLAASSLDPDRTIVRVNPRSTGQLDDDLAAVRRAGYRTVMLAKAETEADLAPLAGFEVIAICESPLGVRNADVLAALDTVVALTWGAEDLVAGLGGSSSRFTDGAYRPLALYARSRVLVAAGSEGKPVFDTVHTDIADVEGLRAESEDAAASGFAGAMCIHPSQVATIRGAFSPSETQIVWARSVLAAAERAGNAAFAFEGRMVDEPILRQARKIVGG
ncbi:MAG: CoA ester lyase [Actinomycetota bacterium]